MMGTRARLKGGAEYDIFSRRWRRLTAPHAGAAAAIKAKFWRRMRKLGRLATRKEWQ